MFSACTSSEMDNQPTEKWTSPRSRLGRVLAREVNMKIWLTFILCSWCLAAAGCRGNQNIQLLERELRIQEDSLYEMEDLVDEYESKLEKVRKENASLREELNGGGDRPSTPTEAPPRERPSRKQPSAEDKEPNRFVPPKIELPPGLDPLSRKRRPNRSPAKDDEPALIPANGDQVTAGQLKGDSVAVEITETDNTRVRRIRLNKLLTGGYNSDGENGDEGITAVIEPCDADDQLIAVAAPVAVVVLDPAIEGEAARVARWDFSAEEVAKAYRKTPLGEGFCLEMPWSTVPPRHARLKMFVRYTTSDGRNLEAAKPIDIALAGRVARDWKTADPPTESTSRPQPSKTSWRTKPRAAEPPPAEQQPIRTASRPSSPPAADPPNRPQRPVWSPNR